MEDIAGTTFARRHSVHCQLGAFHYSGKTGKPDGASHPWPAQAQLVRPRQKIRIALIEGVFDSRRRRHGRVWFRLPALGRSPLLFLSALSASCCDGSMIATHTVETKVIARRAGWPHSAGCQDCRLRRYRYCRATLALELWNV
jgi:hypothetical protein